MVWVLIYLLSFKHVSLQRERLSPSASRRGKNGSTNRVGPGRRDLLQTATPTPSLSISASGTLIIFLRDQGHRICVDLPKLQLEQKTSWWFQTNPVEKYAKVKMGIFPQVRVKIKNIWNHHLENIHTQQKKHLSCLWFGNLFTHLCFFWGGTPPEV